MEVNQKQLVNKPIIITEYPKSGGTWITSMIGDALGIPMRDIYMRPGFKLFKTDKHPWYRSAPDLDFPMPSVIKSHELPGSQLIDFDATFVHLVRDGRDVVVSKWFFEKYFCVKNNIIPTFDKQFDAYVKETANEWCNYVNAWAGHSAITIKYEDFLYDPIQSLGNLLKHFTNNVFTHAEIKRTVMKYKKDRFAALFHETFRYNTVVRKCISGDWKNYFSEKNIAEFESIAGKSLVSLGYELKTQFKRWPHSRTWRAKIYWMLH